MRRFVLIVACLAFTLGLSANAGAHLIYVDPTGVQSLNPGDVVNITVCFEPTGADNIFGWGQAIGYDTSELTYSGFTLGSLSFGSVLYTNPILGADYVYVNSYDWSGTGIDVAAGNTYQLFTLRFTFNGGSADGADIWLKGPDPEDVFMSLTSLGGDEWTDSTEFHVAGGPDFSSQSPVPIPGAVWLLGSGLLGLVRMRKQVSGRPKNDAQKR